MKQFLMVILGLIVAGSALSSNWTSEIKNVKGNSFAIDWDSIKTEYHQNKQISGAWIKVTYIKNDKTLMANNKYYRSAKHFRWFDCSNKTISNTIEGIYYDISGNIIATNSAFIQNFSQIIPDSIDEYNFNTICSLSMWKEYDKIPASLLYKDSYQIKQLSQKYPYSFHMVEEHLPKYLNEEEFKQVFPNGIPK